MERLQALMRGVSQGQAIQAVLRSYERLTAEMADFERITLEDWCSIIASVSEQTLKQSLLRYTEPCQEQSRKVPLVCPESLHCRHLHVHTSCLMNMGLALKPVLPRKILFS